MPERLCRHAVGSLTGIQFWSLDSTADLRPEAQLSLKPEPAGEVQVTGTDESSKGCDIYAYAYS